MGLFSGIKKALGDVFSGGGTLFGALTKPLLKPISNAVGDMFGMGAMKDMAANQSEQLRLQNEANKLNTMNEMNNVVQIDDNNPNTMGSSGRRRKQASGAFSSGISLNY